MAIVGQRKGKESTVGLTEIETRILWLFLAYLRSVGLAVCAPASSAGLWLDPGAQAHAVPSVAVPEATLLDLFSVWREQQQAPQTGSPDGRAAADRRGEPAAGTSAGGPLRSAARRPRGPHREATAGEEEERR
jgi:hypothetical protein